MGNIRGGRSGRTGACRRRGASTLRGAGVVGAGSGSGRARRSRGTGGEEVAAVAAALATGVGALVAGGAGALGAGGNAAGGVVGHGVVGARNAVAVGDAADVGLSAWKLLVNLLMVELFVVAGEWSVEDTGGWGMRTESRRRAQDAELI